MALSQRKKVVDEKGRKGGKNNIVFTAYVFILIQWILIRTITIKTENVDRHARSEKDVFVWEMSV